jgi:hypothetical protein
MAIGLPKDKGEGITDPAIACIGKCEPIIDRFSRPSVASRFPVLETTGDCNWE